MLDKLERRLGRYAIPNLTLWLIGGYIIGYILYFASLSSGANFIAMMTLEPARIIYHFEIWRLITWVMIPPSYSIFWGLIMMLFYYQLGRVLEQTWGTFRFNVYIFSGILFTVIGAFLLYGVARILYPGQNISNIGTFFSTSYINMSIFLAFAVLYGDMQVYLYFVIPIKMRWLAIVYAGLTLYELLATDWGGRVAIIASLLNFFIFFLSNRKKKWSGNPTFGQRGSGKGAGNKTPWSGFHYQGQDPFSGGQRQPSDNSDRDRFGSQNPGSASRSRGPISRHKCAVCGRTEITNPELEFRFCSKCNGNYEYCQDHLFNHKHVI